LAVGGTPDSGSHVWMGWACERRGRHTGTEILPLAGNRFLRGFSVLKQKNFVSIYFPLKLICLRNAHYLAVKNFWQAFYILYFHHSSLKLF
jgi:hypothetical protein